MKDFKTTRIQSEKVGRGESSTEQTEAGQSRTARNTASNPIRKTNRKNKDYSKTAELELF